MKFSMKKKNPQAHGMRQNKEAQSHNSILYDSLMNYIVLIKAGWLEIRLLLPVLAEISQFFKDVSFTKKKWLKFK